MLGQPLVSPATSSSLACPILGSSKQRENSLHADFGGDFERLSVLEIEAPAWSSDDDDDDSSNGAHSDGSGESGCSHVSRMSNVSKTSAISVMSLRSRKSVMELVDVTPINQSQAAYGYQNKKKDKKRGSQASTYAANDGNEGSARKTIVHHDPVPSIMVKGARPTNQRLNRNMSLTSGTTMSFGERGKTEKSIFESVVFESSPDSFVKELAEVAQARTFEEGQVICTRGSPGESIFIIQSGSVGVCILATEEIMVLEKGDYWGEANILGLSAKWDATLTAKTEVHICELIRDNFLNTLYRWPDEQKNYEELQQSNRFAIDHGTLSHTVELLQGLSNSALLGIDNVTVRRFYFPGQAILTQGSPGDSMVILVRGQCDVEVNGGVVRQEWRGSCAVDKSGNGSRKSIMRPSSSHSHSDLRFFLQSGHISPCASPNASDSSDELEFGPTLSSSERLSMQRDKESKRIKTSLLTLGIDESSSSSGEEHDYEEEAEEPVCFGELGLLGIQLTRTASIIAQSVCQVRILYRSAFMKVLEDTRESLDMQRLTNFLTKRYQGGGLAQTAPPLQTLQEVAIFKEVGCSEPFLEFLSKQLEDKIYLVGQRIIEENVADDRSMYILGHGLAKVLKDGAQVGALTSGAVFGELVLLGLESKRQATVIAEDVCYAQVLHQRHVVRAMEMWPEERQKILMIAFKKSNSGAPCKMKTDGTPDWIANSLNSVIQSVQKSPTFGNVGSAFIEDLSTVAVDHIFMPGHRILEEGAAGNSLFIMVSGQAQVYIRQDVIEQKVATTKIGMLAAGGISGELAMLGISKTRSATVEAETICVMWEVSHEKAMPIIDAHPNSRTRFLDSICKHLEHTVSNCIDGPNLFRKFDRKFRMLIGLYCERHAYFPGQPIFEENRACDGMCILNLGQGRMTRKTIPIKMCTPGSCFNSTVMLGAHKMCFCTLTATATCHVVVISRSSYVQALEQYPSEHAARDLARDEKAATEELRESVRRLCTRGQFMNKGQAVICQALQRLTERSSDEDVLRRFWKKWWKFTLTNSRQRRDSKNRKQWTHKWIQNQRQAVAHRQQTARKTATATEELPKTSLPEVTEPLLNLSPQDKATKYKKLSSLYLGSRREWESMVFVPKAHRQRQLWGLPGSSEAEFGSSQYSAPRTPRDARTAALGRLPMMEACPGLSGPIWPGGNRSEHLGSWDAAEALGW